MHCIVLVTAKNTQEAKKIAKKLLEAKLIACANVIKDIESHYWWKEKIERSNEVMLVLKTKRDLFKKVVKTVKMMHSYDVPEIIALEIINGYNPYLQWIDESLKKGKKK